MAALRALTRSVVAALALAGCSVENTRQSGDTCLSTRECATGLVCVYTVTGDNRCTAPSVYALDAGTVPTDTPAAADTAVPMDTPAATDTAVPMDTPAATDTVSPVDAPLDAPVDAPLDGPGMSLDGGSAGTDAGAAVDANG